MNEFNFTLPRSEKVVTFKLLTQKDENNIQSELKTQRKLRRETELTTRLKYTIVAVDGDKEKRTIKEFVDNELLAMDSRALRNYIKEI